MHPIAVGVLLASVPMALIAAITWRLNWPRWKLVIKVFLYPIVYAGLSLLWGHWSIAIAWAHQSLGLTGHIWFCRKHGFTWYAVENPAAYIERSKAMLRAWSPK